MALQLTTESTTGQSGNYWKIIKLFIEYSKGLALCTISLYKDASAAADGKEKMQSRRYEWAGEEFTDTFGVDVLNVEDQNPQERAYEKLKTLTEFDSATDV